MNKQPPRIIVILGPTAIGKSDLAVELALQLDGEVISADSRQVYKGLDIGTGKITAPEMRGVPHHCLDIADPHDRFTAMDWKRAAETAVDDILSRGKLPIVCGGTGFYISTLVDNLGFPEVEAQTEEQKALETKTVEELFEELKKLDPVRASTIDLKNKRRLSRAILIARELGSVPPITKPPEPKYKAVMLGLAMSNTQLKRRIYDRLVSRLGSGMIEEARELIASPPEGMGLTLERMDELGLEYRYLARYLDNKLTMEHLVDELSTKIWQYAKRQMTWFKKDKRIVWLYQPVDVAAVIKLVK